MNGKVGVEPIIAWLEDYVGDELCSVNDDLLPFLSSEPGVSMPFISSAEKADAYLEHLIHCHGNPNVRAVIEGFLPTPIEEIAESLVLVGRRFPALQIAILNEQYNLVKATRFDLHRAGYDDLLDDVMDSVRSMIALRLIEVLRVSAQTENALKLAMTCAVVAEDQVRGEGVATGELVDWHAPPDWVLHPYGKSEHNQLSKVRFYDFFIFYRGMILRDHPDALIEEDEIPNDFCDQSIEWLSSRGAEAVRERRFKDILKAMHRAAVLGVFGR